MKLQKKLENITQMEQESLGTLLELPELPKVPRMGLLLRHGTREEQETPETEATAAEAAPAPEEMPVTKAPAAPEPEAYSVDEILRRCTGGSAAGRQRADACRAGIQRRAGAGTAAGRPGEAGVRSGRVTPGAAGAVRYLRRGAGGEPGKGRWTDEEHLEYLSRRLAAADGQCGGGGGAAGVVPGTVPVRLVQHPVQLGSLRHGVHQPHQRGGGQRGRGLRGSGSGGEHRRAGAAGTGEQRPRWAGCSWTAGRRLWTG